MIAELLLLQGLLDKTNMVTPPESISVTTSTSTYNEAVGELKETVEKYKQAYEDYIDRGRRGFGL
jgi:predicted RNase H-like HicB family nuclease